MEQTIQIFFSALLIFLLNITRATFDDVISSEKIASQPDILTGGHLTGRAGSAVAKERPQEELGLLVVLTEGTKVQLGDGQVGQVGQCALVQTPHLLPSIAVTLNKILVKH